MSIHRRTMEHAKQVVLHTAARDPDWGFEWNPFSTRQIHEAAKRLLKEGKLAILGRINPRRIILAPTEAK